MLDIYSSSAGSGKTYTLTREYLQLALNNSPLTEAFDSNYFKSILAITFTNDAANEMKTRITTMLRYFYAENPAGDFMLKQIGENINQRNKTKAENNKQNSPKYIDLEELRRRAKDVLMKIIYDYSDFSVSTIDTFANKVVAAFTQELNMPFNYATEVSTDEVLQVVADNILSKVGETENHNTDLTGFMIDYALYLAKEGKSFKRISNNLAQFGNAIQSENATEAVKNLSGFSLKDFIYMKEEMKKELEVIENQIYEYANIVKIAIETEKLTVEHFKYKSSGSMYVYFFKIIKKKFIDFFADEHTRPKTLRKDGWEGDLNPEFAQKMDNIKTIIQENFDIIESIRIEKSKNYILYKNVEQEFFNTSLINELQDGITQYQDDANINLISNNNKRIATIVQSEPVPFIYERIGEKYHHLLVDEFQDTSVLQWENLLPLIENSLAQENFNMLVGDVKQSIYRWRGGKMQQMLYLYKKDLEKLLHKKDKNIDNNSENSFANNSDVFFEENTFLEERYSNISGHIQAKNLATNFRSTKEIVEFNNSFFEELKDLIAVDKSTPEQYLINAIYDEDFKQAFSPNIKAKGEVRIVFKKNKSEDEDTSDTDFFNSQIFEEIDLIIDNSLKKGFSYKDIAIICKVNASACEVATHLKSKNIPIVSKESLLIASNEVVCMLVAFMKVLAKPDFSIAKAEALYLFHKEIKHQIPDTNINEKIRKVIYEHKNSLSHFFTYIEKNGYKIDYERILSLSLYEIVEELLVALKVYRNIPKGEEYVFRFLDYILEFSQKSNDLSEFLEDWDAKRKKISIQTPKDIDAVTLITIHKSKGLEFPVVIVPFANWQFGVKGGSTFWVELPKGTLPTDEKNQSITNILYPTSKEKNNDLTRDQLEIEKKDVTLESVNQLYVAFTRAVYDLHIISKASSKSDSIGSWLKRFVAQKNGKSDSFEDYTYVFPENPSAEIVKISHEHKEKTLPNFELKTVISSNKYKNLHTKKA